MGSIRAGFEKIAETFAVGRHLPVASLKDRAALLWIAATIRITSQFSRPRTVTVRLRLEDGRVVPFLLTHWTDLAVLGEVFIGGQYADPELDDPKVIIDAGAHIGATASYFAARYPDCRVIALEASPQTAIRLRRHTESFPNVEVHNVALGVSDGTATFYERRASWGSSLTAGDDAVAVNVPMLTVTSVFAVAGVEHVDLLKLDIEGAEFDVLRSHRPDPATIGALVGELHTWHPDVDFTREQFFDLLSAYEVTEDTSGGDHVFRAVTS